MLKLSLLVVGNLFAGAYDQKEAVEFAHIALAAYCGAPLFKSEELEKWNCGPVCDAVKGMTNVTTLNKTNGINTDAFAYVGILNDRCTMAFRGTGTAGGWFQDLISAEFLSLPEHGIPCHHNGKDCKVGCGWLYNYEILRDKLKSALVDLGCNKGKLQENGLSITGHSLGAAEAMLAMMDLHNDGYKITKAFTFGSPRVGDKTFFEAFSQMFPQTPSGPWRITHDRDPVVHLPFEGPIMTAHHLATEVFYPGNATAGYAIQDQSGESPKGASQYWDLPKMIEKCAKDYVHKTFECDHLTYMMPEMPFYMSHIECQNKIEGVTCNHLTCTFDIANSTFIV